jgi:hypothetical protein
MQKVVTSEPKFALGRSRYTEIMKAVYKAKDRREGILSTAEMELLANADAAFDKYPPTDPHHVAFRVVRGQCYLNRVHKAVEAGKAVSAWRDDIRTYFENQDKLIAETKSLPEYSRKDLEAYSQKDQKLAEDIGIKNPGSTFFLSSPAKMMRESAMIMIMADASLTNYDLSTIDAQKMPCPFTLNPSYGPLAIRWLETALVHIKHDERFKERETMRTLMELAKTLALQGQTENAVAKLQAGLEAYPKSDEFKSVEELLRELLEAPPSTWCKSKYNKIK